MKGRLIDLIMLIGGKQRLTLEVDADFRADFERLRENDVRVEVKQFRKRRSLDANAYAWVLIDKIAEVMQVEKSLVYRSAIKDIGGVSDTVCVVEAAADKLIEGWAKHGLGWQADKMLSKIDGCVNVTLYYGSSTYDTKQMSALIDHLVQDAKSLGIETLPPSELERLLNEEADKGTGNLAESQGSGVRAG